MIRTTRRRAAALLSLSTASLVLAGCGSDDETSGEGSGSTTVRVATSVSNSFPFIAVQAGETLGTWDESGLDVEVVEGTTPTIGQIMAGGDADIALAGAGSEAVSIRSGVPMTIVASNLSYWDQRIIASPGTTSVEDLKGGNFGITGAGSPGEYTMVRMAEELGWSESDYTFTSLGNLSSLTAALQAGSIDAFAWSSQAAFQMEESGDGVILAPGSDFVGENVLQAFAVVDSFAQENPDTVRTFFEAYFETVERMQAEPQLFIDVLVNEWDVPQPVAERLAAESLPELSTDGTITDEELAGIQDTVGFTLDMSADEVDDVKFTEWTELS
ncbi:ABC transporter substrate-binding protein [Jiangella asiatica]|nr:ABC transporter substrate-binding protein [Jiangella asiatica]